jgi:hypothetical protein
MTLLAMRLDRKGRRRALSVWKIAGWVLVAAVGGLLVAVLSDAVCDAACGIASLGDRVVPSVLTIVASILVSVGAAVGVHRAAGRVPTRRAASAA